MIEFSRLTVLLIAELMIALSLISGLLVTFGMLRKHAIRKVAQQLVERIRHDMGPRSERLKQKLITGYGYEGDLLKQALHALSQAEKRLYQNLITGFLKQDPIALQQIDVDVDNLVLAYQGLEPALDETASTRSEQQPQNDEREEIERLQADNRRLAEELKVTMDTMGRMISEYALMVVGEEHEQSDKEGDMGELPQDDANDVGQEVASPTPDADLNLTDVDEDLAEFGEESAVGIPEVGETVGDAIKTEEVTEAHVPMEELAIEEVLEVDDDFSELLVNQTGGEPENESKEISGSLMDELEPVDIMTAEYNGGMEESEAKKPRSLEEEWAMLLEEDAKSTDTEQLHGQDKQV
jgi:hypothetical protein